MLHQKMTALFLSLCLGITSSGWAQTSVPVRTSPHAMLVDGVKAGEDMNQQQAVIAGNVMKQAFKQSDFVEVVDQDRIKLAQEAIGQANTTASVDAKIFLAPAFQELDEGKYAYRGLAFRQAQEKLLRSRNFFLKHLKYLRANQPLLEAHLFLGMTYLGLAKEQGSDKELISDAKNEFRKVVYLDNDHRLSGKTYSPEIIEVFEQVKQSTLAQARVTLEVDSNVKRANVFINGQFQGKTPWAGQVLPGTYFVLVEDRGHSDQPWTKLVTLQRPVEKILAGLSPVSHLGNYQNLFRIREGGAQQSSDVNDLKSMAVASKSRYLFLGNVEKIDGYRLLGQLWDAETGEFSQVAFIQMGPDYREVVTAGYDLAQALIAQIGSNGYLVTSKVNQVTPSPEAIANQQKQSTQQYDKQPQASLLTKWWFWAGIAVVGGGAYYFIGQQQGSDSSGNIKINNQGNF